MSWTGDTFLLTCGEYAIETQYCSLGARHISKFKGQIIGYAATLSGAKAHCDRHEKQTRRAAA